jgi:hypothetical protein
MELKLVERYEKSRPAVFGEVERPKSRYTGVERRRKNRRIQSDRREDLRFELDTTDRRASGGRRADDSDIRFW